MEKGELGACGIFLEKGNYFSEGGECYIYLCYINILYTFQEYIYEVVDILRECFFMKEDV